MSTSATPTRVTPLIGVGASWRIGKQFRFEATRQLNGRADGHSFTAEAVLGGLELDPVGFVIDFGRLSELKRHIDDRLDHQCLNDRVPDASDEGLAAYLTDWAKAHLPDDVAESLVDVRIRTGRRRGPAAGFAVEFEATHHLEGLPAGHPCGRRHGHSYLVSAADADGCSVPVPEELAWHIGKVLDGSVLNESLDINPTSEHLACYLSDWVDRGPATIRVSETESSWAQYTRSRS
ncbi:6-carboxytetrahydropterin synthase [Streptomyces sp. BE147]|uniref:6-pyruvoyl trahydropterin synthase family protein n=1 Tax=Streptomyces sp. BE147 TaxID=3002524 RepID=UPI002E75E528|nr:6-carboxytetrahydropterin synthase [Streptomyces sp. BE147]MEE1736954.1 6-carboxytetrahydropterin synthase [Streptomyces sp. BE147]